MTHQRRLDIGPDTPALDNLQRRDRGRLAVNVAGVNTKAAGRDAADIAHVNRIENPAEQFVAHEHRSERLKVHLMADANQRIVLDEKVTVVNSRKLAEVLNRPAHHQVRHPGEILEVRGEDHAFAGLILDRGIEVERERGHR